MRTFRTFLLAVLVTMPVLADAQGKGNAKEVVASSLRLPAAVGGLLELQACTACNTKLFRISDKTLFEIGDESVSMDELRRQFATNPNQPLLLELTLDETEVRRIWLPRLSY